MGKLDEFMGGCAGYYRENQEKDFPWHATGKAVWYSLSVCENGKIVNYGFTSAKGQKENLILALTETKDDAGAMLFGIWTGSYSTHLFILDIEKAIEHLSN